MKTQEKINSIRFRMCDNYCRFPFQVYPSVDIELVCASCPLKELEVSSEPKKGKWIPHSEKSREYIGTVLVNVEYDYFVCDTCGYPTKKGQTIYNFCPNCGSKMEVKE